MGCVLHTKCQVSTFCVAPVVLADCSVPVEFACLMNDDVGDELVENARLVSCKLACGLKAPSPTVDAVDVENCVELLGFWSNAGTIVFEDMIHYRT